MLLRILDRAMQLPLVAHVPAAIVSVVWFQWAKAQLDASYAASLHPVDFFTGQTGFSAGTIKGYYAAMAETKTLDVYFVTQLIDFGFILGVAMIGMFTFTLIARLGRADSWARKIGRTAGLVFVLGAVCDAIENGWSFIMLANPTGFADWLALSYSSFAVLKFGLMTLGMILVTVCILLVITGRILKSPKVG